MTTITGVYHKSASITSEEFRMECRTKPEPDLRQTGLCKKMSCEPGATAEDENQ